MSKILKEWVHKFNHPFIYYVFLCFYFCWPLLKTGNKLGIEDWDQQLFYYGAVLKSVFEFHEFPFWNPWYCGGNVLWQNPQVALLSPVYLFAVFFSLPLAMKLNIMVHYYVGLLGMHFLLTRVFKISFLPLIFFLSSLVIFGGTHALHLATGHSTFLPFFYVPFILFLFFSSLLKHRLRPCILAGVLGSLVIYNAGIHIIIMLFFSLGIFCGLSGTLQRTLHPIKTLCMFVFFTLAFSAPKLLPAQMFLSSPFMEDTRTLVEAKDVIPGFGVRVYLDPFLKYYDKPFPSTYLWREYGNFIGSFGYILIMMSLIWVFSRNHLKREDRWLGVSLSFTSLILYGVSLGDLGFLAPFSLLKWIPFFAKLRCCGRYTIFFVPFAVLTSAWVLIGIWKHLGKKAQVFDKPLQRFLSVLLILLSLELVMYNRKHFQDIFTIDLPAAAEKISSIVDYKIDATTDPYGPGSPMYKDLLQNKNILSCYEPLQLQHRFLSGKNLVFSTPENTTLSYELTPNTLMVKGNLQAGERIFFNQNNMSGWSSDGLALTRDSDSGLLYVEAEKPGEQTFRFSFFPSGLLLGLLIFLISGSGAIFFWRRDR